MAKKKKPKPGIPVPRKFIDKATACVSADTLIKNTIRGIFMYKGERYTCSGAAYMKEEVTAYAWKLVLLGEYSRKTYTYQTMCAADRRFSYEGMVVTFKGVQYVMTKPKTFVFDKDAPEPPGQEEPRKARRGRTSFDIWG